ncbi:MAG TPA: Na+/H+ antiporter [Chloroflexi bacterium]|nr:Na+/H+ antiporter [Chloroflexota bacterium]HBY09166.1 Na+/H+ antiporter [Chloroflexota bacterium]
MMMLTAKKIYPLALALLFLMMVLSACSSLGNLSESFYPDLSAAESAAAINESEVNVSHQESSNLIVVEEVVIALLLIAAIVGIITRRLRVPYTVGLVLIGLVLSIQGQLQADATSEIFLALLVPPLVFEAAFHLNARDLQNDIVPILALAIPGVLITTGLVGVVVAIGTATPLSIALLFGALVAATDPVAVVALFRSMGVPKRLQVLLEGESLLNDGTAIVVFNLMVVIVLTHDFSLIKSVVDFLVIAGGGIGMGLLLGMIFSQIIRRIDDPLIETTLTGVLAFGAYLIAEQIHVSGVLAVVAAGLVAGNIGPRGMSASTKILVFNFWEIAAFVANSMVFLLIGLQINLEILAANWHVILVAIIAVLVARAVGVYALSGIGRGMPVRYKHVLFWGGLRGAISLALAISLPVELGDLRNNIQTMAFGVVLFTLLVQGLTMQPLIRRMKLIQHSENQQEYERRHARAVMSKAAYDRLDTMQKNGLLSAHVWKNLAPILKDHTEKTTLAVFNILQEDPKVEFDEYNTAQKEALLTQRNTLASLLRDGIVSEEIFAELAAEVDEAMTDNQVSWLEGTQAHNKKAITNLLVAIIQEQDLENAITALTAIGVPVVRMPSAGEFLGRHNITILIGVPKGQEELITKTLQQSSQQRIEILPQDEGAAETAAKEITIGATLFSFEIERYEEL